jgi:hypothetical protein
MQLNQPVALNHVLTDVFAQYQVHLDSLVMDEHALRLEYRVLPPIGSVNSADGEPLDFRFSLEADDDLGNYYGSVGGACGLQGNCTAGVISVAAPCDLAGNHPNPPVPTNTTRLNLRLSANLRPYRLPNISMEFQFIVVVQ